MRMRLVGLVAVCGLALCVAGTAFAGGNPEDSGEAVHVDENGYAAHGADVVAYFSLEPGESAVMGAEEFAYEWRGATWLFANEENLDAFREDPERYAPEYGGYCAYAIARDKLAPIDPDRWDVVDGSLYLNYSGSTQRDWREHQSRDISRGDELWPEWSAKLQGE